MTLLPIKLRDYQDYAVNGIFEYFANNRVGNPIIAMPTGTGKSVVIGEFIRRAYLSYPRTRVLQLTHVKELIDQNHQKLLQLWPSAPAGVFSAGLGRKDILPPIIFAGIKSIINSLDSFPPFDLIISDECHLIPPDLDTTYMQIISYFKRLNPHLKVIGFSATPFRLKHGLLTESGIFTDIAIDMTELDAFNWFIDQGYLVNLIPQKTKVELDITGVGMSGGDFKQKQLQDATNIDSITEAIVKELIENSEGRDHYLLFGTGVEHVQRIYEIMNDYGINSTYVHSKMGKFDRDKNIADFRAKKYTAMVNKGILTTGYDDPAIDLIGALCPTVSPGLWGQILGRGTRPLYQAGYDLSTADGRLRAIAASEKKDCKVLDFARNTARLGPINDLVIPKKKDKKGPGGAPVKICEVCSCYVHASKRTCPNCGWEFPRQVKLTHHASEYELVARSKPPPPLTKHKVDRIIYKEYRKNISKPSVLEVCYYCGLRYFKEFICLEHEGFPGKKARDWWRDHSPLAPPVTVGAALNRLDELKVPEFITVLEKEKYPEIMGYIYENRTIEAAAN